MSAGEPGPAPAGGNLLPEGAPTGFLVRCARGGLALLAWLVVSPGRTPRGQSGWRVLLTSALVMAAALLLHPPPYLPEGGVALDATSHPLVTFELRFNAMTCDKYPYLSTGEATVRDYFADRTDVLGIRAPEIVGLLAGSVREYCDALTEPYLINENSLGVLFRLFMLLDPNLSLSDLGNDMILLGLVLLGIMTCAMVALGLSPLLCAAALLVALRLEAQQWAVQPYAVYPLLLPMAGCYIVLLATSMKLFADRRRRLVYGMLAAAGAFAGFYLNLRTSHGPLILAGAALTFVSFWVVSRRTDRSRGRARRLLAAVVLPALTFAGALLVVHRAAVDPGSARAETEAMLAHHVVAHPLVLSLALPPNTFAEGEGIRWLDRVGLDLARRVDPDVTYLGPSYESALWEYYWSLWKKSPEEMVSVYLLKWRTAGEGMLQFIEMETVRASWLSIVKPLGLLGNGIGITAAWLVFSFLVLARSAALSPGSALSLLIVATFGLLLLLEAAAIHSPWNIFYHSPALLALVLTLLACYQVLINAVVNTMQRGPGTPLRDSMRRTADLVGRRLRGMS